MMSWMWFCSPSRTMGSSPTRWYRTTRSNDVAETALPLTQPRPPQTPPSAL
ncbi:hypothetical protein HMPREF1979_00452 [Actinomyces johnsonii F0542]|uniref:Uncharacterized protein n=1 Tax=Actinomyces johnsonii F0542 TaxID=1321818 RepID=U1QCI5_9ACTO|nr:hypothetical protein HMPREF1979_00452 [Actinomyces johnsonii F0542]